MSEPKLISSWEELKECTSETHILEIDLRYCCGWVKPKVKSSDEDYFENNVYLSTHTFYGSQYQKSTEILQRFGFNVQLKNWG